MGENEQGQQSEQPSRRLRDPRFLLSLIVVLGFVATILVFVIGVLLEKVATERITDVAAAYSGIIGVILGYYFGKNGT